MDLKKFAHIPIIVAIVLISVGIYIGSFSIENPEISSFITSSEELTEKAKASRSVMEERTTKEGLTGIIEDIPVFGHIVKAGRFLASIVGTLRTSTDLFMTFLDNALSQSIIGIPSEIVALLLAGVFITFGFSVYRALKG